MGISSALPINQQLSKLGNSLTMWWLLSSESGQPSCMYPMYPGYNCLMMALFLWGLRYKSPDWSILCRLLRDFLREGPVELTMVAAAPPLSKAGQLVQQCSAAGKVHERHWFVWKLNPKWPGCLAVRVCICNKFSPNFQSVKHPGHNLFIYQPRDSSLVPSGFLTA